MPFPEIMFGTCEICGGNGDDDENAGSMYSTNYADGNGYPLKLYKGKWACQLCIKREKADDESLIMADKHKAEEEFRSRAGFAHEMED